MMHRDEVVGTGRIVVDDEVALSLLVTVTPRNEKDWTMCVCVCVNFCFGLCLD